MKRALLAGLAVCAVACGSSSSSAPSAPSTTTVSTAPTVTVPAPAPAPVLAAQLVIPASAAFSSPDCDTKRSVGAELGLATVVSGCHFTGVLQNVGAGCATNIHGTTIIVESGGASSWTVSGTARPNQLITYTGGPVTLPVTQYHYQTQPLWDNIAC